MPGSRGKKKPYKVSIKAQQLLFSSVKQGRVNCHVSKTGKYYKIAKKPYFLA